MPIGDYTDRLIREEDGSLFAYRCRGCGCAWKIYQQETHYAGCVHRPDMTAPEIGSQLSLGAVFRHRGPQNDPRRHYMHIHATLHRESVDPPTKED